MLCIVKYVYRWAPKVARCIQISIKENSVVIRLLFVSAVPSVVKFTSLSTHSIFIE